MRTVYVSVVNGIVKGYSDTPQENYIPYEADEDFIANPFKYDYINGEFMVCDSRQRVMSARLTNASNQAFLDSTDWKVTRHRDQQALGCETSLTNEEYTQLLADRQTARESIINK